MTSQTKTEILQEHEANAALNAPTIAPVSRHAKDLGADGMLSPLDERIIAASSEALEAGQTHYVDVPGIAPLRAAIAESLNSSTDARYEPGNIIVAAGVQESRFLSIQKIGENFESIAVPAVAHPGVQKALGVRARKVISLAVDAERGYLPAIGAISDVVAGGCRLLYLESPSRLSGAAYSNDEVAAIGQALQDGGAAAIWDHGLAPWVEGGCRSLAGIEASPTLITTIGEAFPGMGLASWHIGYIAAPEDQIPAIQSQKQIMAICTSTAAQYAALEASGLFVDARNLKLTQLTQLRSRLIENAADLGLDVIAGAARNIIALRAAESGAAKLRGAGYDFADGAFFGAPAVIRLNVNAATADALQALS